MKVICRMLPGEIYHLYNHANGEVNLFNCKEDYSLFLEKLSLYALPVSKICSYSLMPNHFHLVAKMRAEEELINCFVSNQNSVLLKRFDLLQELFEKKLSKAFSNMFNSYAQAFNKKYKRKGSLFMQNMKQGLIMNDLDFCKVVHYAHTNPVHHGFVKNITDWRYSSYNSLICSSKTQLDRKYVLDMFGGLEAFVKYHQQSIELKF